MTRLTITLLALMALPAAALAVVTIATKFVTGWLAGATVGGTTIAKLRAGALLSARGEFSIIIAGLALTSTLLPPAFHALVATYVLITAAAAPIMARFIEPIGWHWDQRRQRRQVKA